MQTSDSEGIDRRNSDAKFGRWRDDQKLVLLGKMGTVLVFVDVVLHLKSFLLRKQVFLWEKETGQQHY